MQDETLARLTEAQTALDDATEARFVAIEAARDAGHTWRTIATALGMTERAATALMQRRAARLARQGDRLTPPRPASRTP